MCPRRRWMRWRSTLPTALATGSDSAIPEGAPAWSPDGTMLAFSSARTGTSQIFTMPAAGGTAVQVTNEVGGRVQSGVER